MARASSGWLAALAVNTERAASLARSSEPVLSSTFAADRAAASTVFCSRDLFSMTWPESRAKPTMASSASSTMATTTATTPR
jgi:hypothetical protein